MSKTKKLPQQVIVRWEIDNSGEYYLEVVPLSNLALMGLQDETCMVGIYNLSRKQKVINRTTFVG
ncbi:MAG TPA: hypothetical protein DCS09_12750 [Porphyromonadaceae bacterium]|nr:hypothetical protein [Porphyromonadaceae bacterium]